MKWMLKPLNDKGYMNYENCIKNSMQMVESKLKMIISEKPYLIKLLERNFIHPQFRNYSNIPSNNQ